MIMIKRVIEIDCGSCWGGIVNETQEYGGMK